MVKGYSRTQILLHWVIAAFIVFQLIFGEAMGEAWEAVERGTAPVMSTMVWAHILVGAAVLILALWRLSLRFSRGVPPVPANESAAMRLAAHVGHWALYALMVLAPATGLLAWFGGVEALAEVHELMKPLLILLIVVHFAAALWHQFLLKDNLLDRMRTPGN